MATLSSTPKTNRLLLLAVIGGLALGLVFLANCREAKSEAGTITLRFWNGFTGPDGRAMLTLVRKFNAENPDVKVIMQRMDWSTYYNKLFVAGLGGRAPDVFVIHTDALNRFQSANFLRPLDDLLNGDDGIEIEDFDANILSSTFYDGSHYGIPLDVHVLGMFYNRQLFREAGIVGPDGEPLPPTNREEFIAALEKLKNAGPSASEERVWPFVYTWYRTNVYTLMRQFGGEIFDEEVTRTVINSPENVAALEFAVSLIDRNLAPAPEAFDSWIGFRQGRVGIAFEGIYMLPDLAKQPDLDWAAAPLPLLGDTPAAWGASHNLCLRADLDDREVEASWRFIQFLSDNSLDWAEGGQIPVRKSLRETERFQKMHAQREFARQMENVVSTPAVPFVFEYISEFDLAAERALRGNMTPQQALDTAAANIEKIIRRYRGAGEKEGTS